MPSLDEIQANLMEKLVREKLTWQERVTMELAIWRHKVRMDPRWTQRKQAALTNQSQSVVSRHILVAEAMDIVPDLKNLSTEDEAYKYVMKLQESLCR